MTTRIKVPPRAFHPMRPTPCNRSNNTHTHLVISRIFVKTEIKRGQAKVPPLDCTLWYSIVGAISVGTILSRCTVACDTLLWGRRCPGRDAPEIHLTAGRDLDLRVTHSTPNEWTSKYIPSNSSSRVQCNANTMQYNAVPRCTARKAYWLPPPT